MSAELERIRERLDEIGEELADLAMQQVRDTLDAGADPDPDVVLRLKREEQRLTRARRAVAKAASILGSPDDEGAYEP